MDDKFLRRQFRIGLVCLFLCSCFVTAGHKEKLCELAKKGQLSDELILEYYQYALGNAKKQIPAPDEFWDWLSRNKQIERGLLVGLNPEYNPHVVTNLQELRKKFGTKVDRYPHLALAFSFVYGAAKGKTIRAPWMGWVSKNRPVPSCSESFAYYVNNKDKLLYPLNRLPWPLMSYVADNDVPLTERQWVLDRYKDRLLDTLSRLHVELEYIYGARAKKLVKMEGAPMSLPRLMSSGGVCSHQAYYASASLKCLGVPSVRLLERKHAFEGWVVGKEKLKVKVGAAYGNRKDGYFLCPLTRTKLKEYEFKLLVSSIDFSYDRYMKSKIACRVFDMLDANSKKDAMGLLEASIKANPYMTESWFLYAQACGDGIFPFESGWKLFDRAKGVFSDHPELACAIFRKVLTSRINNSDAISAAQNIKILNKFRDTVIWIRSKKRLDLALNVFEAQADYLLRTKGIGVVVDSSLAWFKQKKLLIRYQTDLFRYIHAMTLKSKDKEALEKLLSTEYRRRLLAVRKSSKKSYDGNYSCYAQVAKAYIGYLKKAGDGTGASAIRLKLDSLKDENPKLTDLRDVIRQGRTLGTTDEQVTDVRVTGAGHLVWRILYDLPKMTNVRLRMEHAAIGKEGAFCFTAWADKNGDGVPDTQIGISPEMMAENKGEWSDWEFVSDGKTVFVGTATKKKTPIHYQMGGQLEGYYGLSDRVFYSREFGQPPVSSIQPRYTNIRVEILGK
jgi:hypothetical protein